MCIQRGKPEAWGTWPRARGAQTRRQHPALAGQEGGEAIRALAAIGPHPEGLARGVQTGQPGIAAQGLSPKPIAAILGQGQAQQGADPWHAIAAKPRMLFGKDFPPTIDLTQPNLTALSRVPGQQDGAIRQTRQGHDRAAARLAITPLPVDLSRRIDPGQPGGLGRLRAGAGHQPAIAIPDQGPDGPGPGRFQPPSRGTIRRDRGEEADLGPIPAHKLPHGEPHAGIADR